MSNFISGRESSKVKSESGYTQAVGEGIEYNNVVSSDGSLFESVPVFEIISEGATISNASESKMGVEAATVSLRCPSLGQNGEMLINTIEVSTEELMTMEQMNSTEEVEFIYSSNLKYQVAGMEDRECSENIEEIGTPQRTKRDGGHEPVEVKSCNPNVATIRIIGEPHLVVQRPTNEDFEEEVSPGGQTTSSSIKDVSLTAIDGKTVNLHSMCSDENKIAQEEQRKTLSNSKCITNDNPNVIFTSNIQGLEHQIPVILKTATLAQQAVTAALAGQTVIANDTQNSVPMENCPSEKFSRTTVQVKVSESASVQLQKYFCQEGLCRVCLLSKTNLSSLFEDVCIDQNGMIENGRGPKASNKFHLLAALKTLLDVDVEYNDGLPDVICMDCYDQLMNFSVYRKKVAIGQAKLQQIVEQVQHSNTPTFIPSLGETDIKKTNIYKNGSSIETANNLLKKSQYSHFVMRKLSDRLWDKIFSSLSSIVGYKSGKLKNLEHFTYEIPYVTGFFCYACNATIHGTIEDFAQHHYDFHGIMSSENVLYPCDICGNSYPLKDFSGESQNYSEHWLQHFFLHECNVCNKKLPSSKGLWIHTKSVHARKEKLFTCEENKCEKSFYKKSHLDLHKQNHSSNAESESGSFCIQCKKSFSTPGSLAVHLSTVHGTERPWKCDMASCQKRFKRKEVLISHKEGVHMNMSKYVCEICQDTFKSQSSKAMHLLRHKGEKQHMCSLCSEQFYTSNGLKSHMLKHQDSGEFTCNECAKVFKRAAYLEEHKRTHTGEKPFICPVCHRAIRMKSNYFKHMKIHKRKNEIL